MKYLLVAALAVLSLIGTRPCGALPPYPVFMGEAVRFAATCDLKTQQGLLPEANMQRMRAVATEMTNLGIERVQRLEWDSAECCFLTALHINELTEGSRSQKIAASLNNLIGLYLAQDKYSLAEPLIERFLRDFRSSSLSSDDLAGPLLDQSFQVPKRILCPKQRNQFHKSAIESEKKHRALALARIWFRNRKN
jgi:hypothetical protein